MSFVQGLNLAADMDRRRYEQERQARLDAQQAQLFQLQLAEAQRSARQRADFDTASADYVRAFQSGGLDSAGAQATLAPYGLNREQTRTVTQAQLDEYNRPDSFDLQRAPEGYGLSADSYRKSQQPTLENAKTRGLIEPRMRMAIASGDTRALSGLQQEEKAANVQQRTAQMGGMRSDPLFLDKIQAMVNNTNDRLTMIKPSKPGDFWSVAIVDGSGKGKNIQLSEAQVMQFAEALAYGAEGDVATAQKMIAGVNKDLADAVEKSNRQVDDNVRANNQGLFQQESLRNQRDQIRATLSNRQPRPQTPIQLVNNKTGEAAVFYREQLPTDKNGMIVFPPGWTLPKQRPPVEMLKMGDAGDQVAVDASTKQPLFRLTANGEQLPIGADPWADPKTRDRHGVAGIGRVLGADETGRVTYKYVDLRNPDALPADSPDEVIENRKILEQEMAARKRGLGNVPSVQSGTRPVTPQTQSPYFGLQPEQRLNALR